MAAAPRESDEERALRIAFAGDDRAGIVEGIENVMKRGDSLDIVVERTFVIREEYYDSYVEDEQIEVTTPLRYVVDVVVNHGDDKDLLRRMLEYGVDVNLVPQPEDVRGTDLLFAVSPLYTAVTPDSPATDPSEVVEMLLAYGADKNQEIVPNPDPNMFQEAVQALTPADVVKNILQREVPEQNPLADKRVEIYTGIDKMFNPVMVKAVRGPGSRAQIVAALARFNNDPKKAAAWLFAAAKT